MEIQWLSAYALPFLLALIMLGMGMTLSWQDFLNLRLFPKAFFLGVSNQIILLPLLGFFLALALQLPFPLAVGLVLVAACPGGATSNMMTFLSRGDTALSISLTAFSSLITVFTIPFVVNLALSYFGEEGQAFRLPIGKTIANILLITALPVAMGMGIKKRFARAMEALEKWVKIASSFFILLALAIMIYILGQRGPILPFVWQAGPSVLLLNLISLAFGYLSARMNRLPLKQKITISLETGIQNGTLGIAIASSPFLLGQPEMAIPSCVYGMAMVSSGFFAILYFNKKVRSSQPEEEKQVG